MTAAKNITAVALGSNIILRVSLYKMPDVSLTLEPVHLDLPLKPYRTYRCRDDALSSVRACPRSPQNQSPRSRHRKTPLDPALAVYRTASCLIALADLHCGGEIYDCCKYDTAAAVHDNQIRMIQQ